MITLAFNKPFAPGLGDFGDSDLLLTYDTLVFSYKNQVTAEDRNLVIRVQILKSFPVPKEIKITVPPQSKLRSFDQMRVNEWPSQVFELVSISLSRTLVPNFSDSEASANEFLVRLE